MAENDALVIDLPDDAVSVGADAGGQGAARKATIGGRRERAPASPDADRIASLERERDEAARVAAAHAARANDAEAVAHAASTTAATRTEQAMRAHWAKINADKDRLVEAIAATQDREQAARREFISAREAGDTAREADAMAALSDAKAAIIQLDAGRVAAERQINETKQLFEDHYRDQRARSEQAARQVPTQDATAPRQLSPDEWIETVAKTALGEAGAKWLRENRQYATDPKLNRKLLRLADDFADDHGREALRSQAFLDALDDKFLPDRDDGGDDAVTPPEPAARSPVRASSAPVSRNGNQFFSSRNLNASQVRLPPKLASFLKETGLDPVKYAAQAVADIKAGKLPKNYLDPDYDHGF